MNVFFDPLAKIEFDESHDFYAAQEADLGDRFRKTVWEAIEILERYPLIGEEVRPDIRKVILKHFPYKLIYSVTESGLYIIAVAHGSRRPEYWVDRA